MAKVTELVVDHSRGGKGSRKLGAEPLTRRDRA